MENKQAKKKKLFTKEDQKRILNKDPEKKNPVTTIVEKTIKKRNNSGKSGKS